MKSEPKLSTGVQSIAPESIRVQDEDVALMLAFGQGDEEAFVTLYRRYRDRIVNFARRLLGDTARAEEAAQEVFLKLYRARDRYEPKARFSTFIFRIATNHCLNLQARHEHKLTARDVDVNTLDGSGLRHGHAAGGGQAVAGAAPDTLELVAQGELREALRRALAGLPQNQAAAMVLCHYEGMSYRDAGEALEVSEGAVKSLVHRARHALSKSLTPFLSAAGGIDGLTQAIDSSSTAEVPHAV